jgi:signal transduction histidine kinase
MVYDPGRTSPTNPALIGKDLLDLKDTDGKLLIREFVAIQDRAWVDSSGPIRDQKIRQKTT